jgi:8-oxo-dGTP diphosphatase
MAEIRHDQFYLTVDAVIFTIFEKELKILLVKRKYEPYKGSFAIPGGYVRISEELETAASRELEEETGVRDIFLRQLRAFGKIGRDPRGRIITVPFLALIDGEKLKLHATSDAELARWFPVYQMPSLAFDHRDIVDEALSVLRDEVVRTNIAFQLMPERFTLTELQEAYETILDKRLDKRNFRKKIKELSILKDMHETRMEGAHRPAELYSFKERKKR